MAKSSGPSLAFIFTVIIAVVGLALWVTALIGLSSTGTVGPEPSSAQILFACSGMFASVLFAFAGLIHTATLNSPGAP